MAAVMAHKGHSVIGVDLNPAYVAALRQGQAPVNETGLAEMIHANRERLAATQSFESAILDSEITFIIVPTPSGPDGTFSVKYVLDAAADIGAALRRKNQWHLVCLCSTVMPGSTGGQLLPALEAHSGGKCGVDFGLCYNPEFIALGSVIHDMLNPDMILIGESDERSGGLLEKLYKGVCDSNPRIQRMNFVNAEIAKISVNTYVTTKISYANMLAELCETLPGAEVDVVTAAIGCDSRIGRKYLKGALGYGGPCFPRDNVAFSALARNNGVPALLAEATDQINRRQVDRLEALVAARMPAGGCAGVLGLSYKPETEVVEESQGMALAQRLLKRGLRVVVFDPAAMRNARPQLDGNVGFAASLKDCASQADVLAVMTPWSEFRALRPADMKPGSVLIDCWRLFVENPPGAVAEYIALGCGPEVPAVGLPQRALARSEGVR
jgi:UDPglucose 6-dehydrogenase